MFKRIPINLSNGHSPWGKPPAGQHKGPPEIEQLFKRFFSSGKSTPPSANGQPPSDKKPNKAGVWIAPFILLVLLVLWAFSGIYTVQPSEQAAVLRLGKFVSTQMPGQHWYPRFIDQVYVVNLKPTQPLTATENMLTNDGSVVNVQFSTTYQVEALTPFLFGYADPLATLQAILNNAVQQVVGSTPVNVVLGSDHSALEAAITEKVQAALQSYSLGLSITQVKISTVTLPSDVQDDYTQVSKAQAGVETQLDDAKQYAAGVVPVAQAKSAALIAAAKAYQQEATLTAQTNLAGFEALLPVYQQYPAAVKNRLYMTTMQQVLQHSRVIINESAQSLSLNEFPVPPKVLTLPASSAVSTSPASKSPSSLGSDASKDAAYVRWEEANHD